MSRTILPYQAGDISTLARTLKNELVGLDHTPGHVELLNMLARGAGCRNFQHFRAQTVARDQLDQPPPPAETVDFVKVRRATRHFDDTGHLVRWPGKFSERQLCLWAMWAALPARQDMSEKQVNAALNGRHSFGDHALIRRELVDGGWLERTRDGATYRRRERRPPADATALIGAVSPRW